MWDHPICLLQLDLRYDGSPNYEDAAAFWGSHDTPALFIAIGRDAQALGSYALATICLSKLPAKTLICYTTGRVATI